VKYWRSLRRRRHSAGFRSWLEALTPAPPDALYAQDATDVAGHVGGR
jgi:hypothetical protein